jgi:type IV pilus assembly protein PilM
MSLFDKLGKAQLGRVKIATPPGGRPPAAVEIAPEGVLAAALPGMGQAAVYAFEPLPQGSLEPGVAEANLRAGDAVTAAIRAALGKVSPRTRAVTVVLPDTAVRVFVLDFDSLPTKSAEALPVLRFRLRKMVPFDVEHAGISYQVLVEKKSDLKVLAAVVPGPILQEYEAAVRAAGYEPGAVLPSSLAAIAARESMEAMLTASLSGAALTTSIVNGQDLLLYRTLDLPADYTLRRQEVQRGVAVAAAYYEDKLHAKPMQLYYSGTGGAHEFHRWIDDPELTVTDLVARPETGAATALGEFSVAAVAGALAGVS